MHDLGSISARTQKNDAWRLACGTGHYFYGITGVKTNVKTSRKLKSGVNEITASVRATYGTAHQVRMNSQYRIRLPPGGHGLKQAPAPGQEKVCEGGDFSVLTVDIYFLARLERMKLQR